MDNRDNIQDELNGLNSNLPANKTKGPFSVPDGYFEGLAGQILARVKTADLSVTEELQQVSPFLAALPKSTPYQLPDGYFDQTILSLPFLVNDVSSAVLAAAGKAMPYTVPEGYFEQLPQSVLDKLPRTKAKVVPFFSRTWMKAAVAAMIGGVIFLGGYRLLNNNEDNATAPIAQQPADTSRRWLAGSKATNLSQEIRTVSTTALDEFISSVAVTPTRAQARTRPAADSSEVNDLLKDVSSEDIRAFLDQLPVADDNFLTID
jgi:hypothetical protein